jgi:protein-tyrosine phosphatase
MTKGFLSRPSLNATGIFVFAIAASSLVLIGDGAAQNATTQSRPTTSVAAPKVERVSPRRLAISWTATRPVDVYVSNRADATLAQARLVSDNDSDGSHEMAVPNGARSYFILADSTGSVTRVAERLLPLQRGSNFRDLGGYPAANGKHVRWGKIYRSGATAMLSNQDVAFVGGLGIKSMIDLRSTEELRLAPTRLRGVGGPRYISNAYPMMPLLYRSTATTTSATPNATPVPNGYVSYLTMLAPQYRAIFDELLAARGAVSYNCSAGQDRTGVATALVLSALGVPRATILEDYHLSTRFRRPENEMPPISVETAASDPVANFFANTRKSPDWKTPRPLYSPAGTSRLGDALDAIDARWGSVENYLRVGMGITDAQIATLRAIYLE